MHQGTEIEHFLKFLAEMREVMAWFQECATDVGVTLDFTVESLDLLERLLQEKADAGDWQIWIRQAARYLGEVYCLETGGRWELCQGNARHPYFGLPVILDPSGSGYVVSPHQLLGAFKSTYPPGFLRRALEVDRGLFSRPWKGQTTALPELVTKPGPATAKTKRKTNLLDQATIKKFARWIAEADGATAMFLAHNREECILLDFTIEGLDQLERSLDGKIGTEAWDAWQNEAARYLGTVFLREIGGSWALCQDPRDACFRMPVVVDFSDQDEHVCPYALVRNYGERRLPGMLRRALEADRGYSSKALAGS